MIVLLDKFLCLDSSNIFVSASMELNIHLISNEPTKSLRLGFVSRNDNVKGWIH